MPRIRKKYEKWNIRYIVNNDWNGDHVENGLLCQGTIELNENISGKKYKSDIIHYDIMHGETKIAEINTRGETAVFEDRTEWKEMIFRRLHELKNAIK